MSAVIGLDVGTSGVKGIALAETGEVLARVERGYPLSTPRPGWSEQDPESWWLAAEAVLAELQDIAGTPSGIGLSGQMHGLVTLDAKGRPVRPAILWNDQRTAAECAEIEERIGLDRLIELTGNRALTGFTAPKLLWLRRHEPDAYARIASVMLPKDYVRLRLCGVAATDVADASGTLLFDVAGRRWSSAVCDALEVDHGWLPPALESPEVSGRTAAGVPVAAGAGDQAAGALGVGVVDPGGPLSVVLGTSGVVFAALGDFAADPAARAHTFCHAVPGTWHAMGVMLSAAGSLQWLRDVVAPGVDFGTLVAEAAAWEPGVEGLTFLPYLAGERTPHADPEARGSFTGLTLRHDRGALVRAVLEGVAFGLGDCLDVLTQTGATPTSGLAGGGGARSDLWLTIVASVLGLPLARTAVDEGAAFGAALLGGCAGGVWSGTAEAVAATVRTTSQVEPDPDWTTAYAEVRGRYRALYPALSHLSHTHHQEATS
ncbi:Xylulose kinase [Paraconexibacter sp. AEG42_29]|uniref:Xylulose kinase n=1 Tax=Paraconexibacter sp. AEG42_29 TaxID=2997339 RepID=A0AAU7AVP1_9ACTN